MGFSFHYKNYHKTNFSSQNYSGEFGYSKTAGINTYPRRAISAGADRSLTIYLTHNIVDNDCICNQFLQGFRVFFRKKKLFSSNLKFQVSVHNPLDLPRMSKYYFQVPLNKYVKAAVKPEKIAISENVKKLSPEKRNCYLETERPLKFFKIYTQSNCLLECLTNFTLEACGCVSYFMPSI